MSKEKPTPSIMTHRQVYELADCLDDEAALALFRAMIGFVVNGSIEDFEGIKDERSRKMLKVVFDDFQEEAAKGVTSYKKRQKDGEKGQLKKRFIALGREEEDFNKLWLALGGEPDRVRAEVERLLENNPSPVSGNLASSGLTKASY